MAKIRIQKALSAVGVASRRDIEQMVTEGRITLNGKVVTKLPCFVEPGKDEVYCDTKRIKLQAARKLYFMLNKPKGVVCTQRDPQGRPRAIDLLPKLGERLYCVGRLDVDSTGIILLTNDGDLTEHLTHPRYGVSKTYVVEVDGRPEGQQIEILKKGMYLDGVKTKRTGVKVLHRGAKRSVLEIRLTEGRNREIRRLLARLGHKVRRLKRVAIGSVTDKGLKVGSFRQLKPAEVAKLRASSKGRTTK